MEEPILKEELIERPEPDFVEEGSQVSFYVALVAFIFSAMCAAMSIARS